MHQDWRNSHATSTGTTYGAHNIVNHVKTANVILELAAATAADQVTMVSLTVSIQTLTTQLASTHAKLVQSFANGDIGGGVTGVTGVTGVSVGQ